MIKDSWFGLICRIYCKFRIKLVCIFVYLIQGIVWYQIDIINFLFLVTFIYTIIIIGIDVSIAYFMSTFRDLVIYDI